MTRHLTQAELDRYLAGSLGDRASADIETHVAACLSCRTMVDDRAVRAVRSLRPLLEQADDVHVDEDDLMAYVDGSLDAARAADVSAHIEVCDACERLCHALEDERDYIANAGAASARRWRPTAFMAMAAGLVAAVTLGLWWTTRPVVDVAPQQARVETPDVPTPAGTRVVLSDGPLHIRVDADGRISGLPTLGESHDALVRSALSSGVLDIAQPAALRGGSDTLMGGTTAPAATLAPAGEVVESTRPEFTWTAVAGATEYTVTVLDHTLRPVASSPALRTRRWIPTEPLPRGASYVWQVSAATPSGLVVVPAPPAPEARFGIVDADVARTLDAARASGSNLTVAVVCAKAGLLADAERALLQLVSENPDSKFAANLLAQVRQAR